MTIASIHMPCYQEEDLEAHLEAHLNVMQKPYINTIGHPDDGRYPVVINFDAHVDTGVGDQGLAWELLRVEQFPQELVVNCDLEKYFSYINHSF